MTFHGCTVRSLLTGCRVTSRPRDRFLRYSKWQDAVWTALIQPPELKLPVTESQGTQTASHCRQSVFNKDISPQNYSTVHLHTTLIYGSNNKPQIQADIHDTPAQTYILLLFFSSGMHKFSKNLTAISKFYVQGWHKAKFHNKDPQKPGPAVKNLVAMVTILSLLIQLYITLAIKTSQLKPYSKGQTRHYERQCHTEMWSEQWTGKTAHFLWML